MLVIHDARGDVDDLDDLLGFVLVAQGLNLYFNILFLVCPRCSMVYQVEHFLGKLLFSELNQIGHAEGKNIVFATLRFILRLKLH